MADVLTGATGIQIDNVVVGTSSYRQAVVVGGISSGQIAPVSTGIPSTTDYGLFVRQVPSTGSTVGLTTSSVIGLTTTSLVTLSSGSLQIGALAPSSSNVIGSVAASSIWSMVLNASSATVIGSVAPSSAWTVALASGSLVALSSGASQIGVLGPSSANVIGSVSASSVWSMVLNASSATAIGSVAPTSAWTVVTSTAAPTVVVGQSSDAATDPGTFLIVGGPVATTAIPATVTTLKDQQHMLDNMGRQVTVAYPRGLAYSTFTNLGTTAETIIVAAGTSWGTGVYLGITTLLVSNRSTDTPTEFWMQSSSGGAAVMKLSLAANGGAVLPFSPPFSPLNSTQNWTGINQVVGTTVYVQAWVIPTL